MRREIQNGGRPAFQEFADGLLHATDNERLQQVARMADTLKDRLLGLADEASIAVALQERPWAFDGNGD